MTLINQNHTQSTFNFNYSWQDYVTQNCYLHNFEAKSQLISTAARADALFLLKQGRVKLSTVSFSGHERVVGIRAKDDFVGLELISEKSYYSLDAVALTNTQAYLINQEHLFELQNLSSDFSTDIAKKLNSYTFDSWEQINNFHLPLKVRIALLFLRLGERYGEFVDNDHVLLNPYLTQQDIGNFVNATRVSVSTNIGRLKREGRIAGVTKELLLNLPKLKQLVFPYQ